MSLRKTRIGYFEDDGRTPVTSETRRAIRARRADVSATQDLRSNRFGRKGSRKRDSYGASYLWTGPPWSCARRIKGREADMYSVVREIIEASNEDPPLTAERIFDTLFRRDMLRARFLDQMERFPILLCPVNAVPAFRHGERSWTVEGRKVEYLERHAIRNGSIFSAIPRPSCPWSAPMTACRSECRSSGGPGKKNASWPSPPCSRKQEDGQRRRKYLLECEYPPCNERGISRSDSGADRVLSLRFPVCDNSVPRARTGACRRRFRCRGSFDSDSSSIRRLDRDGRWSCAWNRSDVEPVGRVLSLACFMPISPYRFSA